MTTAGVLVVARRLRPRPSTIAAARIAINRDAAVPLLQVSCRFFPFIARIFADYAYAGDRVANAARIAVEIFKKLADQVGFVMLPPRSCS